jgi:hypothetical protein
MIRIQLFWVFRITHIQEALVHALIVPDPIRSYYASEEVLCVGRITVYPGIAYNNRTNRELQLLDLGLDPFIGEGDLLHFENLGSIPGGMDVIAQKNMVLDFALGDVDNRLVEFALTT